MTEQAFWKLWERYGLLVVICMVGTALSFSHENFLTVGNITNFINQAALIAILGFGMTFAIASGGFDLSVGSIFALSACVGANIVSEHSVPASVAASLAVGCSIGLVNGLIIAKLRVPALIATLGMMTLVRGTVLLYTQGQEISIFIDPAKEAQYKFFGGGHFLSLPVPMLLMVASLAGFSVLLNYTPFGRHVCAVGSNEEASITSGLNVDRIKIIVFALVGLCAGLASVIQTSQLLGVSGGTSGLGMELEAIAVVVLGGTSLRGGRANLPGAMLGAVLVAVVRNGLNLHDTPLYYQYLVMGLILLLAVSLDGIRGRRTASGPRRGD